MKLNFSSVSTLYLNTNGKVDVDSIDLESLAGDILDSR